MVPKNYDSFELYKDDSVLALKRNASSAISFWSLMLLFYLVIIGATKFAGSSLHIWPFWGIVGVCLVLVIAILLAMYPFSYLEFQDDYTERFGQGSGADNWFALNWVVGIGVLVVCGLFWLIMASAYGVNSNLANEVIDNLLPLEPLVLLSMLVTVLVTKKRVVTYWNAKVEQDFAGECDSEDDNEVDGNKRLLVKLLSSKLLSIAELLRLQR